MNTNPPDPEKDDGPTSIRTRCSRRTKRDWEWFADPFKTNEDALQALMIKAGVYEDMAHRPNFNRR